MFSALAGKGVPMFGIFTFVALLLGGAVTANDVPGWTVHSDQPIHARCWYSCAARRGRRCAGWSVIAR